MNAYVDLGHAADRAMERYGISLLPSELKAICDQCASGRAPLLKRMDDGREHRIVMHEGTAMIVVYSPAAKQLVTFLPPTKGGRLLNGSGMVYRPEKSKRFHKAKTGRGGKRARSEGRRPEE